MRKKSTFARKKRETRSRAWISILCTVVLVFASIPCTFASANESSVTGTTESSADAKQSEQSDASSGTTESTSEETPTSTDSTTIASGSEEAEESASTSSVQEQENENAASSATAPLAAKTSARSASGDAGTLGVFLSNSADAFEDVDTFADQTTDWELGDLRTMRVDFEFGTGTDKNITISIPTGYQIVGYSATDDTPAKSGVQNISIDPQYIDYFKSSTLIGVDGSTAWEEQTLSDSYLLNESTSEGNARTYGGIATYTFSDSATKGQLVMTLKPQDMLLSHAEETELLDAITVQMTSSQGSASSSFRGNILGIATMEVTHGQGIWGYETANVTYDSDTGLSDQFGIISSVKTCSDIGFQPFYADSWTYTIAYPKGVSFDNKIFCDYLGMGDAETTGGEIVPGHFSLEVTGDKTTGGTVTFTFTNTTVYHSSGEDTLGAYFIADNNLVESSALSFDISTSLTNHGKTLDQGETRIRNLISGDGNYLIYIGSINEKRRDIHAEYPDYPYEYALGGFEVVSELPYADVPLSFDFSDFTGVRGVNVPGYNVHDIVAVTTDGRTITLDSVPGESDDGYYAVPITPNQLGLNENEYLLRLDCVVDLDQLTYHYYYTKGVSYFGRFVDGQEGDVTLSVMDGQGNIALDADGNPITATDHTTIRYEKTGGIYMNTHVENEDWESTSTFHPNELIHFNSYLGGGSLWNDSGTLIDPVIMISLPKGINLDTSSVRAYSEYGNHPNETIYLRQVNTPLTMTIDGVEWTTYYFTSPEPLDMVAMEQYSDVEKTGIDVYFEAFVASNSPEYGQLSLKDCVQWDLGVTAKCDYDWVDLAYQDIHNRAGHGTDYYVDAIGGNFTIKPLIGLNVDLGIRVKSSDTNFFTYDTTDNSIAALTKNSNAEVRISYENTASTDYFENSTIYLPIPKVGNDFTKYFQNIELKDPVNNTDNKTFEFNTNLATQVTLDGFATYYSVDAAENSTAYDPSTNAGTWAPVTGTWYTYDELIAAGKSLADVTMLKLVAEDNIATGEKAEATFELAIDIDARIGQLDYWRAYSKAITDNGTGAGVWNHSSVLAATPSSEGLLGQVFIDSDYDGFFNTDAGDSAYTGGQVTAILSRDDGTMGNLELVINEDGSFRSLNENGSVYYLKPGDYTISFEETDDTYRFSGASGSQASTDSAWYNDLKSENVEETEATYHFTIDESNEMGCYVGIAMTDRLEVISIDVPIKVKIALKADGTWCTPTATDNYILNNSTCAMRVASAETNPTTGFNFAAADSLGDSSASNVFGGTVQSGSEDAQDLTAIDTSSSAWKMSDGSATDGSNRLPLQLTGSIKNVDGHYFTDPIHLFDITYTFEKATAGGE